MIALMFIPSNLVNELHFGSAKALSGTLSATPEHPRSLDLLAYSMENSLD